MGNCLRTTCNCLRTTSAIHVAQGDAGVIWLLLTLLNASVEDERQQEPADLQPPLSRAVSVYNNTFTYEELEKATGGFSEANFLGQGGFGSVYKGVLESGEMVAIKKLEAGGQQGDREFQAEVGIITRVHHRHLVSLVGYSVTEDQRLLVYEFVANNSLRYHLHGSGKGTKRPTMEWPVRFKIALGAAKGLAYLHTDCKPRIIHRDIKSDNILLDQHWEAKISDFGLAKIFPDETTHIEVSRMAGTIGYFPPEYGASGQLTEKSDVYSFGVILLELITGRLPPRLVAWATPQLETEEYDKFVDPHLEKYDLKEMERMVKCAAACVRQKYESRPTMHQVSLYLDGHLPVDRLNEGVASGNTMHRSSTLNPSMLSNGSVESGYYSIISGQEQGNGDGKDDRTAANSTRNSTLMLNQSPGRHILSRTM